MSIGIRHTFYLFGLGRENERLNSLWPFGLVVGGLGVSLDGRGRFLIIFIVCLVIYIGC